MKKFLSIILALTMVIALIPATFAADGDALVYKFGRSSYNSQINISDGRTVSSYDKIVATDTEPWRIVVAANLTTKTVGTSGFVYGVYNELKSENVSVLGFGLLVDKDGAMKAELKYYPKKDGYTADVWLVRNTDIKTVADIDLTKNTVSQKIDGASNPNYDKNSIDAEYWKDVIGDETNVQYLGRVDMQTGTGETTVPLANAEVTSGEYYLVFTYRSSTCTEVKCNADMRQFTLTPLPEDTELTNAFTAKEETHTPATKNVYGYKSTDTETAIVKYEAVTTDTVTVSTTDTENFLYWAQGLTDEKKILSFEPSFEYAPVEGNNYLVAVYRDTANKAEFFNANGQREAVLLTDGTAPALPERVGYRPATAWIDLDGNTVAPGKAVTVSGYNSYVPNYGELISVTVNGTSYNYGDPVTLSCTDVPYYQEGKYFKGWKKDNVIVSTSENYSFIAYKDTLVTAEWADAPFNFSGNGRKIVLDAFNGALMAEFIGFGDNVAEKGIMFTDTAGTRNIAMTTDSSQFVIIPDEAGIYNGYAIVEDSDGTQTLVTDGEYTKGN